MVTSSTHQAAPSRLGTAALAAAAAVVLLVGTSLRSRTVDPAARPGTRTSANAAALSSPPPPPPPPPPFSWLQHMTDEASFPPEAWWSPVCPREDGAEALTDDECHEKPTVPTPRTPWSARTKPELTQWFEFQSELAADAAAAQREKGGTQVAFVGDSIFETFRGTSFGMPCKRCAGVPEIFGAAFAGTRTAVLAIAGDQVQHAAWRCITGTETSSHVPGGQEFAVLRPKVVVLLVGTNNLAVGHTPAGVVQGMKKLTRIALSESGASDALVLPLLPRAGPQQRRVAETNAMVRALLGQARGAAGGAGRVHVSACADRLATASSRAKTEAEWEADRAAMPDGLHPGKVGAKTWLGCLAAEVAAVLKQAR